MVGFMNDELETKWMEVAATYEAFYRFLYGGYWENLETWVTVADLLTEVWNRIIRVLMGWYSLLNSDDNGWAFSEW